jgi:hypothetical protein
LRADSWHQFHQHFYAGFSKLFCAQLIATCKWQLAQLAELSVTCEWHSQDNFNMKKHGEIFFQNKQLFFAFVGKSRM